jgi:hypothetical protein
MSDKNVLNISPDSKLVIEIYKNNATTGEKKVELKVDHGKVRAAVKQKYDEEQNTFKIKTPTAVAGVRGTDFSVSFDLNSKLSEVVTFEGTVAIASFANVGNKGAAPIFVRAGEAISVDPKTGPSAPVKVPINELKKIDKESDAAKATSTVDNGNKPNETRASTKEPEPTSKSKPSKAASQNSEASREPSSNTPKSTHDNSMINPSDLAPDSAVKLVEQNPNRPVNTPVRPPAAVQQATQNVITEAVRNQVTNRKSKVKIEINR